jgi:MFS transporter, DHA3 family, macrolide efflux protein
LTVYVLYSLSLVIFRMKRTIPTFFVLLITQAVSLVGSRMTSIALGIWIFSQTRTATPLLLSSFFAELPGMIGGSLAGVLVDRWKRRTVLILSDAGQAAGTLFLLWSFLSGNFQLWHLYLVSFIQGVFVIFQSPAQDAVITVLVPETLRQRANGIREMIHPFAGIIAPVLAGFIYAWGGVSSVIVVDLITFLAAVAVIVAIHIPQPPLSQEGQVGKGSFWGELAGGWRFVRGRPALLYFLLYSAWINFLLNGPLELTIPYLLTITPDERLLGLVMGVMSVGALLGGLLVSVLGHLRPRMTYILGGMLLVGVMFLVYGVTRNLFLLTASLFIIMVPLPANGALITSLFQVKVPADMQGRIFALDDQLALTGSTISFLLTGLLVDRLLEPSVGRPGWAIVSWLVGDSPGAGIGLVQVVTGLLILAATLWMWFWPTVHQLEAHLPDYVAEEV